MANVGVSMVAALTPEVCLVNKFDTSPSNEFFFFIMKAFLLKVTPVNSLMETGYLINGDKKSNTKQ